jgi:hypothetical protein
MIHNQGDLEAALRKAYGDRFAVFKSGVSTSEAIRMFADADVVIGSHGGAMYNMLWASRNARVVEIMPLMSNGAYPDQGHPNSLPTFAHLAFWTLANMNFQRYYRYYQDSTDMNYFLDIPAFMSWLKKVVRE